MIPAIPIHVAPMPTVSTVNVDVKTTIKAIPTMDVDLNVLYLLIVLAIRLACAISASTPVQELVELMLCVKFSTTSLFALVLKDMKVTHSPIAA